MKRNILILVILVFVSSCSTDQKNIDLVLDLQDRALNGDTSAALDYLQQADSIIQITPSMPDTLKVENVFKKASYYENIGQRDSAAIYYHQSFDMIDFKEYRDRNILYYRKACENDDYISDYASMISLSNKFIENSSQNKAYQYTTPKYKDTRYRDSRFLAYHNLSIAYVGIGDWDRLFYYNDLAHEVAEQTNDIQNLLVVISIRADALARVKGMEEASIFLKKYVEDSTFAKGYIKDDLYIANGNFHFFKGEFIEAIENYQRVIDAIRAREVQKTEGTFLFNALINIGEAYAQLDEKQLALAYIDSAMIQAYKYGYPKNILYGIQQKFAIEYDENPVTKDILDEFNTLVTLQTESYNKKVNEEVKELQFAFDREQALNKKNSKLIVSLSVVGFLAVIGFFVYLQRRNLFNIKNLQMQQRLLRSQMNPHFTFNTLSNLRHHMRKDPEFGVEYLSKFSKHLRLILENSTHNFVLMTKELNSLRGYLDLELLRYPKMFMYKINHSEIEDFKYISIPPMLLQPIVENSIEHGFLNIDYVGEIYIRVVKKNKHFLRCEIEDNGVGLTNDKNSAKVSTSKALISSFLKKVTGEGLTIVNKTDVDEKPGVLVKFLIPYKIDHND